MKSSARDISGQIDFESSGLRQVLILDRSRRADGREFFVETDCLEFSELGTTHD